MKAYDLLVRRMILAVVLTTLVPAPSEAKNTSRLFPHYKHEIGALRLAEVVAVASRTDIVDSGSHYSHALGTGIPDEQLGDGRIASARVYCCGGSVEVGEAIWFFVPADKRVAR